MELYSSTAHLSTSLAVRSSAKQMDGALLWLNWYPHPHPTLSPLPLKPIQPTYVQRNCCSEAQLHCLCLSSCLLPISPSSLRSSCITCIERLSPRSDVFPQKALKGTPSSARAKFQPNSPISFYLCRFAYLISSSVFLSKPNFSYICRFSVRLLFPDIWPPFFFSSVYHEPDVLTMCSSPCYWRMGSLRLRLSIGCSFSC